MTDEGQNGRTPDGESVGTALATELVKQLVILNQTLKENQALMVEIKESIEDLNDSHEVICRTMEILHEQRGKQKLGLSDLAAAFVEAADEVMPADVEEDEPGEEDPRVEAER